MTLLSPFQAGELPEAPPVTARCVRLATDPVAGASQRAVVIVQYRLDPGDGEVVIRGLLRAGWALVAAPVSAVTLGPNLPQLQVAVDDVGGLSVTAAGAVLFGGTPEDPITSGWVHVARQQAQVPVLVGVWGVDLGTDVDLTECARAGKLLAAGARMDGGEQC